jgi:carotenoid cleavage dioxygenase-like enzyme
MRGGDDTATVHARAGTAAGSAPGVGWLVESSVDPDTVCCGGLYRLDVSTGETRHWDAGPGRSANEGSFVPCPDGTEEGAAGC